MKRVKVGGGRFSPSVPSGAAYIGRASPYLPASPFANRHPLSRRCSICDREHDQAGAVAAYAHDLDAAPELVERARQELAGIDLACWCPIERGGLCHGDVLVLVVAGVDPSAALLAGTYAQDGRTEAADVVVELSRTLTVVVEPTTPQDGDCLRWEPQVRDALQVGGLAPSAATVLGWLDIRGGVIVFGHSATVAGDVVVDLTARQFDPQLPRRWFADRLDYCARLAAATGCDRVTLETPAGLQ